MDMRGNEYISEYRQAFLSKEEIGDNFIVSLKIYFLYNLQTPNSKSKKPKNGTGLDFKIPAPKHIMYESLKCEKNGKQSDTLIEQLQLCDSQRLLNPHVLLNRVVYDSIDPSPINKKSSGPYYIAGKGDSTLVFESRFESGNLRRGIQVYEYEYDLILKFDNNTREHTQWYYFSIENVKRDKEYKFNIINLLKPFSLYNEGMKVLMYSVEKTKKYKIGWFRGGYDIGYYQNNIKRKNGYFFSLSFKYKFDEKGKYYFAYCHPYTYTNLKRYMYYLEKDNVKRNFLRRRTLCQTLAGNDVDLLTITSFSGDPQDLRNRKGVVLTSRVHPGESNSSWMMKGVIDYLTSTSIDAQILRDNFVFKIVPMLNPDGVINGNYRCSLAGCDLNRKWDHPSKKLHPTVWHTKEMIRKFKKDQGEVVLFVDLHGHSRKKNIFMYGCNVRDPGRESRLKTRVFPRILWKISKNFSFQDCKFSMSKKKESSARMVGFKELGIMNSFTMEASFCGANFGRNAEKMFSTLSLEEMGVCLCEAILDYCDPDQTRVGTIVKELDLLMSNEVSDDSSVGSDSEGEEKPVEESTKSKPVVKKKKEKKKGVKKSDRFKLEMIKKKKSKNSDHKKLNKKGIKERKRKNSKKFKRDLTDNFVKNKNTKIKKKKIKKVKRDTAHHHHRNTITKEQQESKRIKEKKLFKKERIAALKEEKVKRKEDKRRRKKRMTMGIFESYKLFRKRLFKKQDEQFEEETTFTTEVVLSQPASSSLKRNINAKNVNNTVNNQIIFS